MPKFEVNPGRSQRILSAIFAVAGVGSMVFAHRASSRVLAGAFLLMAWEMAFLPTLPLNLRLGEIYEKARQGWRMSPTSRVVHYGSLVLMGLATYLQWHGR